MTEVLRRARLSHEGADRILQNILSACGMQPVPLAKAEEQLKKDLPPAAEEASAAHR